MFSLGDIAKLTNTIVQGNSEKQISRVSSISSADEFSICFALNKKYLKLALESNTGAIIVNPSLSQNLNVPIIISNNPEYTFVRIIQLFHPVENSKKIHRSAIIDSSVQINDTHFIGANVVIGENVLLGNYVHIGSGCQIEKNSKIGDHTYLHSNVVVCHESVIGENCIIHPGVVIGSDGFGLTKNAGQWVKIPQIGRAVLKDNVEIGANTTIDRGALDDTIIHNNVKLDNQIQVAHNVEIGENTAIAACVGIAGSAKIGKNCQISGQVVVLGHLSIVDNVIVTAMSLVTKSIKQAGVYSSGTPLLENKEWHKNNVRYKQLDGLAKDVKELKNRK